MIVHRQPKILVAILNWGLGHATRSMPIINELLAQQAEVVIASDGRALALLQKEFPNLSFINLPSYNITYQDKKGSFGKVILRQFPYILRTISKTNALLQQLIVDHKIDAIISDNRMGCWSKKVPCVFMTHQIFVQLPTILSPFQKPAYWLNKYFIQQYNECWIPDFADKNINLSGSLTHAESLDKKHYSFVGPLSRMKKSTPITNEERYDILAILSGPEPLRTHFEEILIKQLTPLKKKTLIVRGITEEQDYQQLTDNITMVNFMQAKELEQAILVSDVIISRTGYSTILDLAALGKTAILVPTPGQPEQEYLGKYFMKKKIYYAVTQDKFDINIALQELPKYSGVQMADEKLLSNKVTDLLQRVAVFQSTLTTTKRRLKKTR